MLLATVGVLDNGIPTRHPVQMVGASDRVSSFEHGDRVIDAITEAGDLAIVYATPFEVDADAARANEVVIDWQIAYRSLIEMKKRGAKYVCTSFSTTDRKGAEGLKYVADQLGLTIVASLGNAADEGAFPAALPGVVAVLGDEQRSKVSADARRRADYVVSGKLADGVQGSSYAAARVCGRLAIAGN